MNGEIATTERPAMPAESSVPIDGSASVSALGARWAAAWDRIEQLLAAAGDWLNPILVKETRQALKSFQFTITFVLVLVACWVVTIGGVAVIGPRVFYSAEGGTLLIFYYAVLAFPLAVVVPYAAFRSLAAEREDQTYELLSITTLRPRQIISGKLGSSIVQMGVYFSAIAPCLAFTYLLRGVDVRTIAVLLLLSFFGALGLSMLGILLATVSQQRISQVFVSVAFVALLLMVFYAAVMLGYGAGYYGSFALGGMGDEIWIIASALTTLYVTFFALAFFAAAGMLTFTSENRSTSLRICMLVQQAAWIGWMAFAWIYSDFALLPLLILAMFAAGYWYTMGTLLTSERRGMSQRVKRRLPSSFLGRVFFSWLNPGPASGYMFVVANATTIVLLAFLGMAISAISGKAPGPGSGEQAYLLIVGWGYVVAYLGLGVLVVEGIRRVAVVTMLASVLIHFLVLLAGSGIPTAIQLMSVELRFIDYSLLQITNPFWSLKYIASGALPSEANVLVLIVPASAICILLLNLRSITRELQEVRIALPPRVLEDEAELHPAPPPLPTNPWDEE